jgi:hypothetical protein
VHLFKHTSLSSSRELPSAVASEPGSPSTSGDRGGSDDDVDEDDGAEDDWGNADGAAQGHAQCLLSVCLEIQKKAVFCNKKERLKMSVKPMRLL